MNKSIYTKRKVGNSSFFMSMAGLNVIGGGVGVGSRDIDSVGVNSGSSVQLMGARSIGIGGNMFQVVSGKSCGACPSK